MDQETTTDTTSAKSTAGDAAPAPPGVAAPAVDLAPDEVDYDTIVKAAEAAARAAEEGAATGGTDEAAAAKAKADAEKPADPAPKLDADGKPIAEEPVKPAVEKPGETALLRSVKKREAKLVEERQSLRVETQRAVEQVTTATRTLEQREAAFKAQHALAESDPIAYLTKHHGYTVEDLGRRILNEGRPSPEEEARRAARTGDDAKSEVTKLREEIAAGKREQVRVRAEMEYVSAVRAEPAAFPTLNRIYRSDMELLRESYRVGEDAFRATGQRYSDREIAEYLEEREKSRYGGNGTAEQASTRDAAKAGAQASPQGKQNGSGHQGNEPARTAEPTLTNRDGAERASVPKWRPDMDPDEERQLAIEAAERAARTG